MECLRLGRDVSDVFRPLWVAEGLKQDAVILLSHDFSAVNILKELCHIVDSV